MTLQVNGSKHVPKGSNVEACVSATNSFVGPDNTYLRILEWGENSREEAFGGPKDVIIKKNCNLCLHELQSMGNLSTLICFIGSFDCDGRVGKAPLEWSKNILGELRQFPSNSNNNNRTWSIEQA